MAAFRSAVDDWGVDMLEIDVHASSDGKVVVIHDATLDRTTDGTGPVSSLPWHELEQLDAGHRFVDLGGKPGFRGRGVRLPLLDEVLEAFPHTRINVEIKDERAALPALASIRRFGAEHRALVAAHHERFRRPITAYPGAWGASRGQLTRFWVMHRTPLAWVYTPRADILQVPRSFQGRTVVTPAFLREAHRRNIPVHVWVVNEEPAMKELLAMGVDGIQTDRPDVLARVLTEGFNRPPPLALRGTPASGGSAVPRD
jgi:glycerophosphoryl diester phosphodiesterase